MNNTDNNVIETLKSEKIKLGRFTVMSDIIKRNDRMQNYDYLDIPDGVCILPVYNNEIITIHQYRYPVKSWQYELPGGIIDKGETPEEAAVRELKEETGLIADEIISLGSFYPSFGSTNEKIYLFLAICNERGEDEKEPFEIINISKKTVKDFETMIEEGSFNHGAGLAAWARCRKRFELAK